MWTQNELNEYNWFHYMKFDNGTYTSGWKGNEPLFDWILSSLDRFDLSNQKVIDVGCRDGLLSFQIEKKGASEIVAIDNDLSRGAKFLLIPRLNSKINMFEKNLYELDDYTGYFNYTFCYGVLYHLRYPFLGLKKLAEITKLGGSIIIETGIVVNDELEKYSLCGSTSRENSPYEGSSCIFFNQNGLINTMKTFECELDWCERYNKPIISDKSNLIIDRCIFTFKKKRYYYDAYWDKIHKYHSNTGYSF